MSENEFNSSFLMLIAFAYCLVIGSIPIAIAVYRKLKTNIIVGIVVLTVLSVPLSFLLVGIFTWIGALIWSIVHKAQE